MTCAEFKEIAALLAAGTLDPPERSAAEQHLGEATHEGCFEALRRASETWDAVGRSLPPVRPDERVWQGIAGRIEARPRAAAVRTWAGWAVAAALALGLVGVQGARIRAERRAAERASASAERDQCARDLARAQGEAALQREALALLALPSTQVVALAPQQAGANITARALVNLASRAAVLYAAGPPAPEGKDYELWVIRGDKKLPAGLLRTQPSGAILARIDPALLTERPDALAVTMESAGGAPQPLGPIVLVGALPHT
jgi:hypothetical protein